MEFPIEFPKCPNCGCEDTVCRQVCADESSISKDTLVVMDKKITPIQNFMTISTPTTKILLRLYDTCLKCGLDYCVRIEKTTMPTDVLMKAMGIQFLPVRKN